MEYIQEVKMGKIFKFINRCFWIWTLLVLRIDMLVMGKERAWSDWKLEWNDDGEF